MALTPLTRVQQATVLLLVEARLLEVVRADVARANSFLRQAEERLPRRPRQRDLAVANSPQIVRKTSTRLGTHRG